MNQNAVSKNWSEDQIPEPKRYTLHLFNAQNDAFAQRSHMSMLPKEEACCDRATD